MGTNEEYLDELLKSVADTENSNLVNRKKVFEEELLDQNDFVKETEEEIVQDELDHMNVDEVHLEENDFKSAEIIDDSIFNIEEQLGIINDLDFGNKEEQAGSTIEQAGFGVEVEENSLETEENLFENEEENSLETEESLFGNEEESPLEAEEESLLETGENSLEVEESIFDTGELETLTDVITNNDNTQTDNEVSSTNANQSDELTRLLEEELKAEPIDYTDVTDEKADSVEEMTEAEIDRLLSAANEVSEDENKNAAESEDVMDLLNQIEGDDNLSEINELLQKSDNDEAVNSDDDLLALLGSQLESIPPYEGDRGNEENNFPQSLGEYDEIELENESSGKKKSKKKRKDKGESNPAKKDKAGLLQMIKELLFEAESDEDESENEIMLSDENKTVLKELDAEKEVSEKKGKKKKADKASKSEGGDEDENADKKKKPKEKKPKKEKPPKKEKAVSSEPVVKEKKIPRKKVIAVVIVSASLFIAIMVFTNLIPKSLEKERAREAYINKDYEESYLLFYGEDLGDSDKVLYNRVVLILKLQRRLDSYYNYEKMGMKLEALDTLIEAVDYYSITNEEAINEGVAAEFSTIYNTILSLLSSEYALTEEDAKEIIAYESNVTYTKRLKSIVEGTPFEENQTVTTTQDILPEEEEFISAETTTETTTEVMPETPTEEIPGPETQGTGEAPMGTQVEAGTGMEPTANTQTGPVTVHSQGSQTGTSE